LSAPQQLRDGNVASVVEALRQHGSISRTDLARVTGLSRTTVLSILDQLESAGFVAVRRSDGAPEGSLGRPAARVALQPSAGVALGIFVGREHLQLVVTDLSLTLLADQKARFTSRPAAEPLIDLALELAEAALEEAGVAKGMLVGAALGVPSPVDARTGEVDRRSLEGWSARSVRETLSQRLGTPVTMENDANAEALGEIALGAGQGLRHMIFVHAGFEIGGAIVLDGRLRRGPNGMAGEFAHIRIRGADGPLCLCGRRDCLRSVASGSALVDAMAIAHGSELDLDGLVDLAANGDPGASRAMRDAGDAIGVVVAALCSGVNPEAVIIGGQLGFPGSSLVDAARQRLAQDVHRAAAPVTVLPAELGDVGGALGAASIVVRSGDVFGHHVVIR
jgi:predicted NBD/HSP70 family sugar kinase